MCGSGSGEARVADEPTAEAVNEEPTPRRERIGLAGEARLVLLPTLTVLAMVALTRLATDDHVIFGALASSAFLIYLAPDHPMNRVRTLVLAQLGAGAIGAGAAALFGNGDLAVGAALILVILLMTLFDIVHPPAVGTAIGFAFRASNDGDLGVFAVATLMVALLCGLAVMTPRLLARLSLPRHVAQE